MSRHGVQRIISGGATKQNAEKRSVLRHCQQKASFKHLVQENAGEEGRHKHNHQKHERELSTEGSLSREELDQPCIVQENRSQESEKFVYNSFQCEVIKKSQVTHLPKGLTVTTSETHESSRSFHEPLTTLVLFL